jgi:DNA-binding NtrC family response regulator
MRETLQSYYWPGNIRELLSVLDSYMLLNGGGACDESLFDQIMDETRWEGESWKKSRGAENPGDRKASTPDGQPTLKQRLEAVEKNLITQTLKECRYNRKLAAETLGISLPTLWRKLTHDTQKN